MRRLLDLAPLALTLTFALAPADAAAQQTSRQEILRRATAAYDDFDLPRAARVARQALDPSLGPRDSVWARGVHLLTQLLLETGQPAHADLWARWALRLEPSLPLDSARFLARVIATLQSARDSSVRTAADAAVRETYVWPGATATTTEARFRLAPTAVPISVLVRGVGVLSPGAGVALEPGQYDLEVTADGYLPLRISREALPGVTMELAFAPLPIAAAAQSLDAEARTRMQRSLVTLAVSRYGRAAQCAVGVVVAAEGRIAVAYESIRGADAVTIAGRVAMPVTVAAWDREANLALLSAAGVEAPALAAAPPPIDGQSLLGVAQPTCDAASEAWSTAASTPRGALALADSTTLPGGAALVDYQGRFVGFSVGDRGVLPQDAFAALQRSADSTLAAGQSRTAREVADAERQRYGALVLSSSVRGGGIRVEPLEPWHWPGLDTTGTSPLTFVGPSGRYRVHPLVGGAAAQEVTVTAGTRTRVTIDARAVAGSGTPTPAQATARRRIPRWVWYVAGAGLAAGIAIAGNSGGDAAATSVVISVPNP